MVSSKFSRPVPVQQPPPICKKSVPVMGANFPLHEQSMTVAFNITLDHPGFPPQNKVDGAMLVLGKNIGSSTKMHWQTSPFDDPTQFAWRADLKINTFNGLVRAVFWWVEVGPTIFQFSASGRPTLEQKMWQWKPHPQPPFGTKAKGQILFATTNK